MASFAGSTAERIVAAALTLLGLITTTWAALTHTAPLVVPGATLSLVGGAWLGNALARADVRLLRVHPPDRPETNGGAP